MLLQIISTTKIDNCKSVNKGKWPVTVDRDYKSIAYTDDGATIRNVPKATACDDNIISSPASKPK